MEIRKYEKDDTVELITLFRGTILTINVKDYSKEQVEVWANSISSEEKWGQRLENSDTYVAVINGEIVGFGTFYKGEIHLLYTHKHFQRHGIGTSLLAHLENEAKLQGCSEVTTEASITAKPFFACNGYEVLNIQNKLVRNTSFINFRMKKSLL